MEIISGVGVTTYKISSWRECPVVDNRIWEVDRNKGMLGFDLISQE